MAKKINGWKVNILVSKITMRVMIMIISVVCCTCVLYMCLCLPVNLSRFFMRIIGLFMRIGAHFSRRIIYQGLVHACLLTPSPSREPV